MKLIKLLSAMLVVAIMALSFTGCTSSKKEKILIYTSVEDYIIEDMQLSLSEKFADYDITIEYLSTGDHAARLLSEGKNATCDITYDLEYPYIQKLEKAGCLANVKDLVDFSVYKDDTVLSEYIVPQCRVGGCIVVNTEVLKEKNLPEPTSYQDLLNPEYEGLISMANPKSSGTGYMFLRSLVNSLGEEKAFEYFDKLSKNVFQFSSSGSGPINALLQEEAAIGLCMTGQTVTKINDDAAPFKILYFEEGSPYTLYGQGILSGKESRESVVKVFEYLTTEYSDQLCSKFFPEQIYNEKTFEIKNYPKNIKYADMSNNTPEEKERLLGKWKY